MRKFSALAIALFTVICSFSASAVTIGYSTFPDEQYYASTIAPGRGYMGYASANAFELRMASSVHLQYQLDEEFRDKNPLSFGLDKIKNFRECRGDGSNCIPRLGSPTEMYRNKYTAVMGGCRKDRDLNCVLGLSATTPDGKINEGKILFDDFRGESLQNYTGNTKLDLPDGNSSFLVDIPGAPHAAGTEISP